MNHDWRLFDESLKHIWNRITNVVFIRRFSGARRRSGDRSPGETLNLETVDYPVQVDGFVVTRYLDTWQNGKFRHGLNHFLPKTRDLRRKSLRVAVFQHIPAVTRAAVRSFDPSTADEIHDAGGAASADTALGIEFEIMKVVAEKINFVPEFYVPYGVETARWGSPGENESFDGLLGEAVTGNAAFFVGDLHYTLRHHRLLDLSFPYSTECLTFLTPEALTDNSWKLLIVPFKWAQLFISLK